MSYKFKSIADVDVVNTLTDKASVLIEENGAIKKVPKDEVGGGVKVASAEVGQTIVVKSVDENGKPVEWECVDAQPDWNQNDPAAADYVKNKPFGEVIAQEGYEIKKIEYFSKLPPSIQRRSK